MVIRGNIRKHSKEGAARSLEIRRKEAKGRAEDLKPVIDRIVEEGITSSNGIAKELNRLNIATARGGSWQATQVNRLQNTISNRY